MLQRATSRPQGHLHWRSGAAAGEVWRLRRDVMDAPVKETTAQKAERLKLERNPWAILPDIVRYARHGFDSIAPDDLNLRFRWWGLYTQGDGRGALGGAAPFFMARIRIPNGFLFAHQVRTIADLAERYARGVADVTVRQNVQLHWLRIEDVPDVLYTLWRAGLTTIGACGDVTRNLVGCPLAGVDREEICDASPILLQANRMLAGNPEFSNLPRKYKIGITGCRRWCSSPEINDIGLTGIAHPATGEIGFSARVGGGLSTHPHFGVRLPAFVRWSQALAVVRGITEIFRDSGVLREHRDRARLKYLFVGHGWTAETFLEELTRRIGFALDPDVPETPPPDVYRDHVGIHAQKQDGLCSAGFAILRGRMTVQDIRTVADLADRYGDGSVRLTTMQNVVILNIAAARTPALAQEAAGAGLRLEGSPFWRGTIACTGSEFCKLAVAETKGFARWLVEALEERVPDFDTNLKIHIAGCPNDCGQHWIADVGLQGAKAKVNGQMVDAYDVFLGGGLGAEPQFARRVSVRLAAADVPDTLARLLRIYLDGRRIGESFHAFCRRHTDAELKAHLQPARVGAEAPGAA
ncbi:MAG: nitrite reductase [Bacillati bacterium ANGP1]|uniref:Nitrite reductase n=1 Tax=Candidatus Segetimicrobium genomatis TaxID=2569760 RepID=A0A537K541_9BACT|nr:MAG: nitrite reductase [Terrabacteria group bacterium ANGP1]